MFRNILSTIRTLIQKKQLENELEKEINFHLECQIEENIRRGMSETEARIAAKRSFGSVAKVKEDCRANRGVQLLEELWQDLSYGFRLLMKSPGYTLLALFTLALGIGANSAIFSVIYGVLLKPLPYQNGNQLVYVKQQAPLAKVDNMGFSVKEVEDYRKLNSTLADVAEHHTMTFILLGKDEPEQVQTSVVSANFFKVLGVQPILGRTFLDSDEEHGADPVLVLSYEYWQKSHNADPNIIGKKFKMNDRPHMVIGVLPSIPHYPVECDVYMPTSACPTRSSQQLIANRNARMMNVFARLKENVGVQQADADIKRVASNLQKEYPESYPENKGYNAVISGLQEELTYKARPTLIILLSTAGLVLLLACANVANLALAKLLHREREIAVRKALGASRGRLIRQLLTESTLLTMGGGILGLLLANGSLQLLIDFAARFTSRAAEIKIDSMVLLFTLLISAATGIVFGLLPALTRDKGLMLALKDGGNQSSMSPRWQRLRGVLLIAQVAVCFILLIGAGLMLRSLLNLQKVDPGFNPDNVLTLSIRPNWSKYTTPEQYRGLYRRLLENVKNQPGVISAALANTYPMDKLGLRFGPNNRDIAIEGHQLTDKEPVPQADIRVVSPDYFQTIQLPLVQGRFFADTDNENSPKIALINNSMARHRWNNEDPIGKKISLDKGENWATIVGVVGDVKQYGLQSEILDELYVPLLQTRGAGNLLVRTAADPKSMGQQLRKAIYEIDPDTAIPDIQTMEQVRNESIASPRLTTVLLGLFALLALIITITGISGVMALMVSQRRQEIGIRLALGATQWDILWMVLRHGMSLIFSGLLIGVVGAIALTRLMSSLLFAIEPGDPLTFIAVSLLLALFAAAACFIPARRATLIDPMNVLRND